MLKNTENVTKVADVVGFKVITLTQSGRADETTNILEKSAFRSSFETGNSRIKINATVESNGSTVLKGLCMEFQCSYVLKYPLVRIMSPEINDKVSNC
jgi:ABC-type uncharacterized transport system permease subunit